MSKFIKKIEKNKAVPFCFLAVAVIMIGVGVVRGEHLVVLQKAVNICLECIGIGEGELYEKIICFRYCKYDGGSNKCLQCRK